MRSKNFCLSCFDLFVFLQYEMKLHYGCVIIVVVVVLLVELDHENICSGGGLLLFSSI